MNDVRNGNVFFVWGTNEGDIYDVRGKRDYNDVDEDGDDIQKQEIETGFDGNDDFELDVNRLDSDKRYYYRICVEYEDNNGDLDLACGSVKDFETDDDDRNPTRDVEIETLSPRLVNVRSARLCGDLVNDGGNDLQTWIEFRPNSQSSWNRTPQYDRGEGEYCVDVNGLSANTYYMYKACSNAECASSRSFKTPSDVIIQGVRPLIVTDTPTNIRSSSALLNGTYVANGKPGSCYFNYGRTGSLGKTTRSYNVGGIYGTCQHSFTNLAASTQYCVQAVINTVDGSDTGAIKCFNTNTGGGGTPSNPQ